MYEMTCVKNNNFSGFTPHFTLVYIFVSCVFYTVHYIRDQKKTRTVYNILYYIQLYDIYIYTFSLRQIKKKNYLLIFIHNNGEIIMPNFFFNLYRPTWVGNGVSFYIYIYIYILYLYKCIYYVCLSSSLSHTLSFCLVFLTRFSN